MPYPGLEDINITGVESVLSFPLAVDYYFWLKILLGIWVILSSGFFFEEKARKGVGNFLSAIAYASVPIIVLAMIGSLIGIVTKEILISIVLIGGIIIFVWYVKQD